MKFINYDDRGKDFKTLHTKNFIVFLFRKYIRGFPGNRVFEICNAKKDAVTENREVSEKEKEYNNYLKLLEEKAKNATRITEKSDGLIFLGQYVEKYPEIHRTEVYEDNDKNIYRLDLKF